MKLIEIRHCTRYDFGAPAQLGPHELRMRPREGHDLRIVSSALTIVPDAIVTWRRDLYENVLGIVVFGQQPAAQLEIESEVKGSCTIPCRSISSSRTTRCGFRSNIGPACLFAQPVCSLLDLLFCRFGAFLELLACFLLFLSASCRWICPNP